VVVVRDGTLLSETIPNQNHPVTQEIRSGYRFVVLHAGNLGFYGAWDTVIKTAGMLNGDGVGFVFVGDGAKKLQLEASARAARQFGFCLIARPIKCPTCSLPAIFI